MDLVKVASVGKAFHVSTDVSRGGGGGGGRRRGGGGRREGEEEKEDV
jgi:hypothetical protein